MFLLFVDCVIPGDTCTDMSNRSGSRWLCFEITPELSSCFLPPSAANLASRSWMPQEHDVSTADQLHGLSNTAIVPTTPLCKPVIWSAGL